LFARAAVWMVAEIGRGMGNLRKDACESSAYRAF